MDLRNLMSFNGPNEVQKPGSIKRHEFFVYSCLSVDPKTSCLLMDPGKHQGSIKRHEVLEGKTLKIYVKIGSIKRHEILKGENLDLGPSKDMRFLGPSKDMRW